MADNILRLKVENSEYDQKLKKAAEGIQHLAEVAHRSGGELTGLEKAELDYIKALGDMDTKSRSASGQMRELSNAYKELTVVYNNLNDVEKADEGGRALAASLATLKQRAQEAKAQLDAATQSLNDNGEAGNITSSVMEMLKEKFTVNIDAIKLFNMGLQAAEAALNVAKDAFFNNEEQLDEWGRVVESSHSLYTGFLNALNTGDISGYLSNISQIVKAARDAYDALDELGTFNAFNQINVERTRTNMTESIADYRGGKGSKDTVKAAGEAYKKELQDRKRLENEAYLAALKKVAAERGVSAKDLTDALSGNYGHYQDLKNVMPTGVGQRYVPGLPGMPGSYKEYNFAQNDRERLGEALRHLNDTELQSLQALGAQAQRTGNEIAQVDKQLTRVLNGRQPGEAGGTTTKTTTSTTGGKSKQQQAEDKVAAALLDYNQTIEKANLGLEKGYTSELDVKRKQLSAQERLYDAYGDAYNMYHDPKYKEEQDKAAEEIIRLGGEVKASAEAQKKAQEAARALETAQNKLADAQLKLAEAQESGDLKQIYSAEKNVQNAQKGVDLAQANLDSLSQSVTVEVLPKWAESALNALPQEIKDKLSGKTDVPIPLTTANLDAFIAHTKEQLASSDLGSGAIASLQENLSDATAISEIMATALKNGIDTADFSTAGLMQKLMNGEDIDDATIQSYVDTLNEKLKEKFDETEWPKVLIKFDVNTGKITNASKEMQEDAKNTQKSWNLATTSINSLGNALKNIEDPSTKAVGTVIQAVASAALGFAQASKGPFSNPWEWIAFAVSGLATMVSMITTIHSATGLATGGFVPGNSYSGDNIIANNGGLHLDAGELVLNRSQQTNLANALEKENVETETVPYVNAEQIYLGLQNYGQRMGYGELLFSKK